MGTSSITVFRDDIAGSQRGAVYRQFDSYLESHGFELAYFLCVSDSAKTQADLTSAFIQIYGEEEVGHLRPLDLPIDLEQVVANRVPFLQDFLYIADAGANPYIKVYDSIGTFRNGKPLRQIFEGTPQQLIQEVGRAEDIPDGRIDI
jgi:hypothetical protein